MFLLRIDDEISLQLLEANDAVELFTMIDENREYLREWLPWVDDMKTASDYDLILPMWLQQFAENNGFNAAIRYNGRFVGMIGLHGINRKLKQTSIGYYLIEQVQGKGIMTRCVKALIDYAFNRWDLNRIEIRCGKENKKSRAIPKRLGFTQEGIIRDGEWLYDHFHDIVIYSVLKREWKG
ncbi:GNAT family protein [Bacillus sp. 165]|uniref:GNAT family N-acetyltransferase n=1 Tax=Bacillus sp. 165 TaxID=1529117 RepID=UPI001ADA1235|nr:GNAT family protein [Bacillus sp. 165]MBO9130387.1 GNAT family N-acetyltransferase [Bacillus sp. 165]